jgi:hypothetical protein
MSKDDIIKMAREAGFSECLTPGYEMPVDLYTASVHDIQRLLEAERVRLAQPEPGRQWRGLTTAETKALWNVTKKPTEFADLLQAKLKEKNERDA